MLLFSPNPPPSFFTGLEDAPLSAEEEERGVKVPSARLGGLCCARGLARLEFLVETSPEGDLSASASDLGLVLIFLHLGLPVSRCGHLPVGRPLLQPLGLQCWPGGGWVPNVLTGLRRSNPTLRLIRRSLHFQSPRCGSG